MARIKMTWGGGSSRVFRSAFAASLVSMCASSIMKTLFLSVDGATRTCSFKLRISSMPRFEAASISMTSRALFVSMALHASQMLQGSAFFLNSLSSSRFLQFAIFAMRRAVLVFPVPRGPERR